MKKRALLGAWTALIGSAGLGGLLVVIYPVDGMAYLAQGGGGMKPMVEALAPLFRGLGLSPALAIDGVALVTVVLRGGAGILGGIGLWRGARWGYYLGAMMWSYLLVMGLFGLAALYVGGFPTVATDTGATRLDYAAIGGPIGKAVMGLVFAGFMVRDLARARRDAAIDAPATSESDS